MRVWLELKYVQQKPSGQFFYRRRIPDEVQKHYQGKTHYQKSLGTKDVQMAKVASERLTKSLDEMWSYYANPQQTALPQNIRQLATAFLQERGLAPDEGYGGGRASLKDDDLRTLINALRDKHPKIAHKFCSSAGINLMNIDSDVASFVLEECLMQDYIPLIMHDSFIVIDVFEEGLKHIMKAAITHVCKGVVPTFSQVKNDDLYLSVFHEPEEAAAYRSSRYKARYAKWKTLDRRRKQHPNAVQWPVRPDTD